MMKKILIISASFAGLLSTLCAVNITVSGSTVFESDGSTAVASGSFVSVGYFDGSFTGFSGLASRTWADINSADYVEIFNSSLSSDGELAGGGSTTGISGDQLYFWVFDTSSAPTAVNAQEFGLFTGSVADWTAKGDSPIPPQFNNLTAAIVDNAVFGADLGDNIGLQAVPEPSMYAAISGLLALGWVAVRRRRA